MANGIKFRRKNQEMWCAGFVICDLCSFIWLAVYHEDSERLECKNCNNMAHHEPSSVEEWKSVNTKEK